MKNLGDTKYIQVKPDDFSKADYEIAIKLSELCPIEECDCITCEARGDHLPPIS